MRLVSVRAVAVKAGWLLATVIALLGCRALASALTAHYLGQQARSELAILRAGEPLWQWTFSRPDDLIAGRAFGAAEVRPVADGLRVSSLDGTPFELGLPIERGLDLEHWPLLQLDRYGGSPLMLSVIWQAAGSDACTTTPVRWDGAHLTLDLRKLGPSGPAHCALPANAGLLRLRIGMAKGSAFVLSSAALAAVDPRSLVPSPVEPPDASGLRSAHAAAVPVVRVNASASAEQMLARRDEVTALRPAAITVVDGTSLAGQQEASALPHWLAWTAAAAYGLALLVLSLRPRPAWLNLLAGLLGPLILIAGLQWGQRPPAAGMLVVAAALAFVFHTQRNQAPSWQWIGDWRCAAWWWPLALLPVTALVCWVWGHALDAVPARRALVYLGWAALQQWLILGFALGQLARLLPTPWAVFGAALLFALMHVPNGALMQLCFLAELWWAACFVRQRAILPVALAHASCALLVGAGLVGSGLRSLEVSARFFL